MEDVLTWQLVLHTALYSLISPTDWRITLGDPFWRLYYHDRDGVFVQFDGVTHALKAQRIYLIPAEARALAFTEGEIGQFFCHFSLRGLPTFAMRDVFPQLIEIADCPWAAQVTDEFMNSTRHGKPLAMADECRLKALVYESLARALHAAAPERLLHYQQWLVRMHPVLPALRHLEVHYADGITLATLAELCNLAPVYFGQRFHQLTGKSPIRYLQETRIKAAAQLLAFSDLSIDEIAHRTGIGTRAYFTRLFSRFIEQSPAAYRRAFRASASRGISLLRPDTNGMERYPE